MQTPPTLTALQTGPVFGDALGDSSRRFNAKSRLMRYQVQGLELLNTHFDSHLVSVATAERPTVAYQRIDAVRRQAPVNPGAPIIVPSGALHDTVLKCPGAFVMAAVADDTFRETCEMLDVLPGNHVVPRFPDRRDDELAALLMQASAVVDTGDMARSVELDTCLHRIAVRLVSNYSSQKVQGRGLNFGLTQAHVKRVTDYVQAHIAESLAIDELAALVSLSRHHFLRQFRRSTGYTPAQFVIEQRLSLARSLLGSAGEPVSTVAARCGFTTEAHFSYTFRKRFGQSPSQFRQNLSLVR